MKSRIVIAAALAVLFGGPLGAQGGMDHTAKITGSGRLPSGWNARFDQAGSALTDVDVRQAGTALAFRSGPAAIYWNTKDVASGSYTVSAIFNQKKSMLHEGYGLFVGGQNLSDPTQNYLYMVIKPQSGTYLINHRNGNSAPRKLVAETPSEAINKDAAGTGAAENAMAIRVARDSVHFYINGREVRAFPKAALTGVATDGLAGLRVNHNLDIEVREFGIKR
jgi:hypothetical protein